MSSTRNFRRQHDALEALSDELKDAMSRLRSPQDATSCAAILARMTGVLTVHLAAEDRSLYPRLIDSDGEVAATTAKQFVEEMGGLATAYRQFESRWSSGTAIYSDTEAFREEANAILAALGHRIARENKELYPLADRIATRARDRVI